MSTKLVTVSPSNVAQFKSVRLAALQDSPAAFGSTYAKEAKLADADWLARSCRWNSAAGIGFLAMDDESPVGIVLCQIEEPDPTNAHAISMWVAPTHRRSGVGRLLIDAIVDWCRTNGVRLLTLMVTSNNTAAIEFYRRLGCTMTGRTEPYPNDPALFEYEMRLMISRSVE